MISRESSNFSLQRLEMNGFYPLTDAAIDAELTHKSPGNFALGYRIDNAFTVFYVGRSDSDVRQSLHEWVTRPSSFDRYAPLTKAAWSTRARKSRPFGAPAAACVGAHAESAYLYFAFSYASSAEVAYQKECRNYDDFGGRHGLDNRRPPVRPKIRMGSIDPRSQSSSS